MEGCQVLHKAADFQRQDDIISGYNFYCLHKLFGKMRIINQQHQKVPYECFDH